MKVKISMIFPFKCELKYRPFSFLLFVTIATVTFISIIIRVVEISFQSLSGTKFDFSNLSNSVWLVTITMTTVGYGDIYPQTHFGRFFGVLACIIGMLLVSYLIVGMSSLFDFTPEEHKAYEKVKKLIATDQAR